VPLGVVGDDFEVMAQVDRRLTKVNSVDRIIRVNYPAENLGRHNNILGSIQRGVTTRSILSNFRAFYSFVSSLEPLSVEQALEDPDWIIAMEEELNNFKRNEVWSWYQDPSKM
jgi:hypothetical protein